MVLCSNRRRILMCVSLHAKSLLPTFIVWSPKVTLHFHSDSLASAPLHFCVLSNLYSSFAITAWLSVSSASLLQYTSRSCLVNRISSMVEDGVIRNDMESLYMLDRDLTPGWTRC